MTTYVALLRGINVGGRTKILMPDLRQLFLALGHADVQTYVQSGNVIFTSQARDPSRLARDIEKRLTEDLDVSSTVLLRTGTDLARVVANNPFLGPNTDPTTLHVTFLAETPNPEQIARLDALPSGPDKLALVGREVYLHCPDSYGRTKLNNTFLERRLAVAATTRNWKTVTALRSLAGA